MLPDTRTVAGVDCVKGTRVYFDEAGRVAMLRLSEEQVVQGLRCANGSYVCLYPSGRLRKASLATAGEVQGLPCKAGQPPGTYDQGFSVVLYESGRLKAARLARPVEIGSVRCTDWAILHESGRLHYAKLPERQKIQGYMCAQGTWIRLDKSGRLRRAVLAWARLVDGVRIEVGDTIVLTGTGEVRYVWTRRDGAHDRLDVESGERSIRDWRGIEEHSRVMAWHLATRWLPTTELGIGRLRGGTSERRGLAGRSVLESTWFGQGGAVACLMYGYRLGTPYRSRGGGWGSDKAGRNTSGFVYMVDADGTPTHIETLWRHLPKKRTVAQEPEICVPTDDLGVRGEIDARSDRPIVILGRHRFEVTPTGLKELGQGHSGAFRGYSGDTSLN